MNDNIEFKLVLLSIYTINSIKIHNVGRCYWLDSHFEGHSDLRICYGFPCATKEILAVP